MSRTSADAVAQALADIPNLDLSIIGVFAGNEGSLAKVNVDGTQLLIPALGTDWPLLSDPVRLLRAGKLTVMLGSTQQRSALGVITAVGNPKCTVEYPAGSGVDQLMGFPKGSSPAVGDVVVIDWRSGGNVVTILSSATTPPTPETPTGPPSQTEFRQTFGAIDSGSWDDNSGGWINDVYASASKTSLWAYGTKIADTIPDSATPTVCRIYLPVRRDQGNRPQFGTHGYASRPGGRPTISNLTPVQNPSGWQDLPLGFVDLLKTGAAFGVGVDGAGYAIFNGTQKDGQSGALDIAWRV